MSATIREYCPKLCATEAAHSSAEVALRAAKSQLQVSCASETLLREEVGQLQSGKIRV